MAAIFPIYFAKVRWLESMAAFTIDYASPSYYAKKFYFDSLNYDPINLKYMIERFGHEKIFMGSDYPFLLREVDPGKVIDETASLSEEQKAAMLGEMLRNF